MAVYVDTARNRYRGMIMCHMLADTEAELHAMAALIGSRREWFQRDASTPHYDIPLMRKEMAIARGAILADRRQIVRLIRRIREQPETFWEG